MFKKLKQKIESESEGEQSPVSRNERSTRSSNEGTSSVKKAEESPVVSPEKQSELRLTPDRSSSVEQQNTTPTSQHMIARVHQLLEAGRAQNDVSSTQKNDSAEPSEVETPNTTPNKTSSAVPQSPEKSDYKSDDSEAGKKFDVATKDELLQLAKKQEKALTRYKTKFSEVVDAYKNLQKENEKLQCVTTTTRMLHEDFNRRREQILAKHSGSSNHTEQGNIIMPGCDNSRFLGQ